jgi:hypothetical protein
MAIAVGDKVIVLHPNGGTPETVAIAALEIKSPVGNYRVSVYSVLERQVLAGEVIFMLRNGQWVESSRIDA